jgi:hypothetical protein
MKPAFLHQGQPQEISRFGHAEQFANNICPFVDIVPVIQS